MVEVVEDKRSGYNDEIIEEEWTQWGEIYAGHHKRHRWWHKQARPHCCHYQGINHRELLRTLGDHNNIVVSCTRGQIALGIAVRLGVYQITQQIHIYMKVITMVLLMNKH